MANGNGNSHGNSDCDCDGKPAAHTHATASAYHRRLALSFVAELRELARTNSRAFRLSWIDFDFSPGARSPGGGG